MGDHTSELLCKMQEDERERLLSLSHEELADLVIELYEQLDDLQQKATKHQLTAVYQKDRADRATSQFKILSESGEHNAVLKTNE